MTLWRYTNTFRPIIIIIIISPEDDDDTAIFSHLNETHSHNSTFGNVFHSLNTEKVTWTFLVSNKLFCPAQLNIDQEKSSL